MQFAFTVLCAAVAGLLAAEGILRLRDIADPPAFAENPQYGFLMRGNQTVSTRGYRFNINKFGLRGRDFAMPKPAGIYRIAFLGDSIPYGGGAVKDPDLFVNVVASRVQVPADRRAEAINMSAPGWGIKNIASYVDSVGLYDADLVVWVVPVDDFRRLQTSLRDYPGFPLLKPRLRLGSLFKAGLSQLARRLRQPEDNQGDTEESSETLTQNLQTLKRMVGQIKERGMPVLVVLVPPENGYEPASDGDAFRATVAACSVPLLDLAPNLQGHPEYFIDQVHLSTAGHRLVGETIADCLKGVPLLRPDNERHS
jgi:hypothetical protein